MISEEAKAAMIVRAKADFEKDLEELRGSIEPMLAFSGIDFKTYWDISWPLYLVGWSAGLVASREFRPTEG